MKIATDPKWHFSSGWDQSGCRGLWKELLVSYEMERVQTITVNVAMNPKEVISSGIGALYLKSCPVYLISFLK